MAGASTAVWPRFQVVISSKDGTVFPSFPSSDLSGGDADKILLADIRTRAAISTKLKFTAEGSASVGDETVLSYYMSLRGDIKTPKTKDASTPTSAETPTVKIDLILGGFKLTPTAPAIDPAKYQQEIEKLLVVDQSGAAKVGDLKKLSDTLGALRADSIVTGAAQGAQSDFTKEPLDLTEGQWDYVLRNTRAIHGWYNKGNVLIKAKKRAFDLAIRQADVSHEQGSTLAMPPFYINDDATVDVTETRSAFERELADSGFSSLAVKATGGGGAMGSSATASLAYEKEHSEASKTIEASTVQAVHVAYKFPRVSIELDAYCLRLTAEARHRALGVSSVTDVDRWSRELGNVFALNFTLGGELTSSRLYNSQDHGSLESFKDSVKEAAGMSITSPYATGGFSVGSVQAGEHTAGVRSASQSARLAWKARGGNTLLCSNPPLWTGTIKDYRLWRIMDISTKHCLLADPQTWANDKNNNINNNNAPSGGGEEADSDRAWNALYDIFNKPNGHPVATAIQDFYNSAKFDLGEYNKSLGPDGQELHLESKLSWGELDLEHKVCVGILASRKNIVQI
ncbi:hypothetical protein Micbo1qcDRAFT_127428 [Microdochium bolleyi]|uniref:MACPF-like domain-containing protein n=1 Tax=Microdochium bolleyi TaxID=196109 RepID=A0A136ILW5_9PEZI|nr:hypothetical protein Micbo1qcDRAFT_127428 [Microdochium bolleyi]